MAREQGGRASFYQVRPQTLPVYLDAGLRAFKLWRICLRAAARFFPQGQSALQLRQALNRGEREGMSLEVPPRVSHETLAQLRTISDSWLESTTPPKNLFPSALFSMTTCNGCRLHSCASGDGPIAFATLMITGRQFEAQRRSHAPFARGAERHHGFVREVIAALPGNWFRAFRPWHGAAFRYGRSSPRLALAPPRKICSRMARISTTSRACGRSRKIQPRVGSALSGSAGGLHAAVRPCGCGGVDQWRSARSHREVTHRRLFADRHRKGSGSGRMRQALVCVCLLFAASLPLSAHERISHGRFKDVTLYRPKGKPKQFVLFLSGDNGWNAVVPDMAQMLADRGAWWPASVCRNCLPILRPTPTRVCFRTAISRTCRLPRAMRSCRRITRRCSWAIPPERRSPTQWSRKRRAALSAARYHRLLPDLDLRKPCAVAAAFISR